MDNILIVDDSLLIRKKMTKIVGQKYTVHEADNGLKALEQLKKIKPVCIVSDLLMPEMDGFKLLEILQRHEIKVPVIVLTADIQNETRERCLSLGAFKVLNKPPKEEELFKTISDALNKEQAV